MPLLTHEGWPYQPNLCPVDDHFIDWFELQDRNNMTVFILGPGLHHKVGINLARQGSTAFSITCSPEEYQQYIDWTIQNPVQSFQYKCEFGDVYWLNPNLVPTFDIIYLPHLGEAYGNYNNLANTDREVLNILLGKASDESTLIGYTGSMAWDRMEPVFETAAKEYGLMETLVYKTLKIWQ